MAPMRPPRSTRLVVSIVALLGLAALTCSSPKKPTSKPGGDAVLAIDDDDQEDGLRFRLSEGAPEGGKLPQLAVPPATPLGEAEIAKLAGRLPPLAALPGDQKTFALRERSLPPPRTGETVTTTFPPPIAPPAPAVPPGSPLAVLRHQPDGDVPLAPVVSVTFSHPMVAVTSLAALAAKEVPVKLSPTPPGAWRWVGTKTVIFEPTGGRLPMATAYTVEIPAGTKAATGEALAKAETFTFSTPPPRVITEVPTDGPVKRDPIIFVGFDQRIDPQAVLASTKVAGARLRLATAAEIEADKEIKELAAAAEKDRWVAFKPDGLLPGDARIEVVIGAGTPSAEGPRKTDKPQTVDFRTFGPMKIVRSECGWGGECRPLTPFQIEFTNPIDLKTFKKEMVRVSPELRGLKVEAFDRYVNITGRTKGRTTYTVTLDASLPDRFAQTLGSREERSFTTTSAEPTLSAQGGDLVIVDPAAGPRFSVYTINHPRLVVKGYAVAPADWRQWRKFREDYWRDDRRTPPPGRLAIDTVIETKGEADELTETRIDLTKALTVSGRDARGHVVLVVEPEGKKKDRYSREVVLTWIQVTKLGLDAVADGEDLRVWVTDLAGGAPKGGVEITGVGAGARATSGADGTATIPLAGSTISVLVARSGADTAILPEQSTWWSEGGWSRQTPGDALRWYVADDRRLYKPAEVVKVKGWVRLVGLGKGGDVGASPGVKSLAWKLQDSQGNDVAKGTAPVSLLGGFDLSIALPKTMNLGDANLELTADWAGAQGQTAYHGFEVQEFRRPEFEVTTQVAQGPFYVGGHAIVDVTAAYFAGGGLANAEASWLVTTTPGSFVPPGRDEWIFGVWVPWWSDFHGGGGRRGRGGRGYSPGGGGTAKQFVGHTDSGGKHHLRVDFTGVRPPRASTVSAEATVFDVNRQAWSASSTLLVHPAAEYVGLKTPRMFVQAGEPLELQALVVDLDGKVIPGREVTLIAERLEWEQDGEEWVEKPKDPVEQKLTSGADAVSAKLATKEGGRHRVRATIVDAEGRANLTELTIWVAGGKQPPRRDLEEETVQLIPDKKEYRRGDTAKLLVLAPFADAEGILTLRRSGVIEERRFTIKGTSTTLTIAIQEAWTPNVIAHVALVGKTPRTNDKGLPEPKLEPRPAYAAGELVLAIPPLERRLTVEVTPRERGLDPGGATELVVTVKDHQGKPVPAGEVAVIAVDESVLSLTGYRMPDPIELFYASRDAGVRDLRNRAYVLLGNPDDVSVQGAAADDKSLDSRSIDSPGAPPPPKMAPMAEASAAGPMKPKPMRLDRREGKDAEEEKPTDGDSTKPIAVRTDFSALALFSPTVTVGADGRAIVPLKLPDNLTRYRITAIAIGKDDAGKTFGKGESTVTARLPLMVRPSPPRFLNFGDVFELPVVLQNQTDAPMTVDVIVRATNAKLTKGGGRRVVVPPQDRVEVRFPAAAELAGTARFQLAAATGKYADAATVELPVWTPATTEAFATYGTVDTGAIRQPVEPPPNVVPIFGGLEVTTSSTALQALTDAVIYLVRYPYECSEQMASRMLALAALRDVLQAFQAEGLPSPAALAESVKRDVTLIGRLQNDDGGFAFWRRGDESWPYLTIHVSLALQLAKDKGYVVPPEVQQRALGYLKQIERHFPSYYTEEIRRVLLAYALNVRMRMGDKDPARARKLVADAGVEKLPLEALAWVLPVLKGEPTATAIQKHLANRVVETAGNAHFATSYTDGAHLLLHSDRRADGLILDALIDVDPKNDLIPKLVSGLLAHRKRGRWENTQENAFILIALDRYFRTYEKVTPSFVARVWLGDGYAGEHAFRGRTTERHRIDIPMATVLAGGKKDLVLQKDGAGRMYYRVGMSYAPADLRPPALDAGFTVERRYDGVDDPKDVRRDPDGTWRVKAGARVRVTLTMVAPSRRYHVALVDPLPAGLEALNPALATTGALPPPPDGSTVGVIGSSGLGGPGMPGHYWRWWGPWYEHENLRDERVEAFTSLLWEGVWTYAYVARATTPGTFVVPPPKAEEMYHPETFGRGAGDRLVVE